MKSQLLRSDIAAAVTENTTRIRKKKLAGKTQSSNRASDMAWNKNILITKDTENHMYERSQEEIRKEPSCAKSNSIRRDFSAER